MKPAERRIGKMSPYIPRIGDQPTFFCGAVWFIGQGDVDVVNRLALRVTNLGGRSSVGYGNVVENGVTLFPIEDAPPLFGITFRNGELARAVSRDSWSRISGGQPPHEDIVYAMARPLPPYWEGEKVECYMPTQRKLSGSPSQIMARCGAI